MTIDSITLKKRQARNKRRRKLRLEKHTGIDWVDHQPGFANIRGEQALWRAVITQALEDAASGSQKDEEQYHKDMARHWLTTGNKDFYMVCDFAGFDIGYIQKNIKRALLNQCKWRKESPNKKPRKAKAKDAGVVHIAPLQAPMPPLETKSA